MEFTGYGRTREEAEVDLQEKIYQYQEDKNFNRFFFAYIAFCTSAIFASLYTLFMIVLRPISGTFFLVLLILLFYALGIFDRIEASGGTAGISLIFRVALVLAVIVVSSAWTRRVLAKIDKYESDFLAYLQGRSPEKATLANLAAYAYTLCFATLILPSLFHWAVRSLPAYGAGGNAPERVQLTLIALIAAGIRYFFHPYAKTVTLRGKPRQSLWLDVRQEMPLALAIVIPLVALYLGTADWTLGANTNRTSPIPPSHVPAVSPQR